MTLLQFRLFTLVAFCLFVAFALSGFGPGPANDKPILELIGPATPPDPSPLIPVVLIVAALGILAGYIGMFLLLRWARMTVLVSTVVMVIGEVMVPAHARAGGVSALFAVDFCVASLALVAVSFSAASALFQKTAQARANQTTATDRGRVAPLT